MLVWWSKKKIILPNSDEKVIEVSGSMDVITLCIYVIRCIILEVIIFMVIINSHLTFHFYFDSSLHNLLLAVSTEYTFHLATNFLYTDRTCQDLFPTN